MGKYVRDLDERLEKKVKSMASAMGLRAKGITVEAVRLKKSKTYGEVVKGNDLVTLFTNDPNLVCVALYEDLFIDQKECKPRFDEETENYFIESLLTQVDFDEEKGEEGTTVIKKPELHISMSIAQKYKGVALQKEELVIHTLEQMAEQKKKEKEEKRAEKAEKSKRK